MAARLSSPTSTWAPACTFWAKGERRNGISCRFMHCGIPTEQNRCFICASAEHRSNACTRPGGGADPKKDEHWAEYRKRRAENGKGDGAAGKGKGKGGGKGKGKGKDGGKGYKGGKGGGAPPAMAAEDVPAARACMDIAAAASVNESAKFPREGVALDSWANVWLKHQRSMPESYYADVLHLAFGDCACHRETGRKGVPTVHVPYDPKGEHIDLVPEGVLWERGCDIQRGDENIVISPKGRRTAVQMWGSMPYITKTSSTFCSATSPGTT